jgi:hypothetical protein
VWGKGRVKGEGEGELEVEGEVEDENEVEGGLARWPREEGKGDSLTWRGKDRMRAK